MNPTPKRQSSKTFPTPNVDDLYVYVTVDGSRLTEAPDYGTPHPDTEKYPSHKLSFIRQSDDEGLYYHYFYVVDFEEQYKYNFEFRGTGIQKGNDILKRTFLWPREDWYGGHASEGYTVVPEIGDEDVQAMAGEPFDRYHFATFNEYRAPEPLDGVFVVVEYIYVRICELEGIQYDSKSNRAFKFTEKIVPAEDYDVDALVAAGGDFVMGSDGIVAELYPLNCDWSLLRTSKKTDLALTYTYWDTVSFYWPPVLEYLNLLPINLKSGDLFKVIDRHRVRSAYNGQCVAQYEVSYSATPPSKATLEAWLSAPMLPEAVEYDGVLFNIRIRSCLHFGLVLDDVVGTNHPVVNGNYGVTIPATNYEDWPESINAAYSVSREESYYRIVKMTVYAPPLTV